jgi:hypothetical protein
MSGGKHKQGPVSTNRSCPNEQRDKHKQVQMKTLSDNNNTTNSRGRGSKGRGQREW